ncbi:nucleotidyltransferase domain-containing protein [Paenibacillus radicis (ex Xue et al. 2023)]|uniref:Nucleotidyltransferase domain-containing protein n=1 Tax=Paenibacillus radicis (ex Xue et al. 2023) TaxID=2972489 RepID=A0ABT1YHU2_9BACL|nr:nucleotidyltransferase domain-containing protein [Paenibacillus radicis (ex Xue et al. 2023)]MCR8631530.1 nucleotidyltransferase domain-containing protein [Paenibacillus radicis (ex Xue et al. 2023)]
MDHIQKVIKEQLVQIEQEEQITILYACESGSRAWGFPSRDSDYDVRFIYLRKPEWYLSIFDKRDVIERPINDMLDISGWDLRKALNLFRKSNPPLLEWLQSPISYAEKYSAAEKLRGISPFTFSPKSCMYHYLNMARGNYREYLQGEQVKIKKYFYVLRPVLACEWIHRYGEMAPMEFDVLVDRLIPKDEELWQVVNQLLTRKKADEELDYEPRLNPINHYLEERFHVLEKAAASLSSKGDSFRDSQLDALFREALQEVGGL